MDSTTRRYLAEFEHDEVLGSATNTEDLIHGLDPLNMSLIKYCVQCHKYTTVCPKCGHNSCSGSVGQYNGEDCTMCNEMDKFRHSLQKHGFNFKLGCFE